MLKRIFCHLLFIPLLVSAPVIYNDENITIKRLCLDGLVFYTVNTDRRDGGTGIIQVLDDAKMYNGLRPVRCRPEHNSDNTQSDDSIFHLK